MESPENDGTVFRPSHKPWKSMKPIPTTGMVRRKLDQTDYLSWHEEARHGHFHSRHRFEQDHLPRNRIQRARRDCLASKVLSKAAPPVHVEPAADADWHGSLWGRTFPQSCSANSRT